MIVNSGVINIGDNNIITNTIDYQAIISDLNILLEYTENKKIIKDAIKYAEKKDSDKLKKVLKKVRKELVLLVRELGLMALKKYIECIF